MAVATRAAARPPEYGSPGKPLKSGEAVTRRSFAEAVLLQLGLKNTPANVTKLVSWEQQEGGHWSNSARYNPLNTTLALPGAGNTGTQGNIKVYTSWEQGITATVQTLRAGAYAGVRSALGSGSQAQFEQAVNASPWGTKFPGGGAAGKGVNLTKEATHIGVLGGAENFLFGGAGKGGVVPEAEKGVSGGWVNELLEGAGKLAITGVLLLAGAVLVVYGIMVAVRPRESALSIPVPKAIPV